MLNLSLNELKLVAKLRDIKGYKSISRERLLRGLSESESVENRKNLENTRIKKIREDFNKLRGRFLKPKIKKIRRNLYEIENKKNLSKSKIKRIEENLLDLEKNLFKFKKYYDYDNIEYKGISDAENLFNGVTLNGVALNGIALSGTAFNQSIDENYYKPMRTKSAFNSNYIEYESKGDKDKNLSP